MIGCWCESTLVEKIDRARRSHTRSQFCREAIAEKLRTMGVEVPEQEAASPDRIGKGGPKAIYRLQPYRAELNESRTSANAIGKQRSRKKTSRKPRAN